jgi:hypothetical protein
LIIDGYYEQSKDEYIFKEVINLNQDEILVSYLKAELSDTMTVADLIRESYLNEDKELIRSELDVFFEKVYSTKVCWKIFVEDEKFVDMNKCKDELILDSTVEFPFSESEIFKVKLQITGYVK